MGHRTYLTNTSKEQSKELFEANNSIPFFWLTLIDIETIERSEPEIIKVYKLDDENAEQGIDSTTFKISKSDFLKNAGNGAKFIKKHFPNEIELYNDFISYLDLTFNSSDILELSLIEMASFNDVYILIKSLKDEINAIKTDNIGNISYHTEGNLFSNLTGYDRFLLNTFKNHSNGYRIACENEDALKKINIDASKLNAKKEKRSKSYRGFLMLFIGLIFMFGSVFVMTKEGITLETTGAFIFGLALLVVSYFKLKQ